MLSNKQTFLILASHPPTRHPCTRHPPTRHRCTRHPPTRRPSARHQSTRHPFARHPSTRHPCTRHPPTRHPSTHSYPNKYLSNIKTNTRKSILASHFEEKTFSIPHLNSTQIPRHTLTYAAACTKNYVHHFAFR